jgi:hypothetical protein
MLGAAAGAAALPLRPALAKNGREADWIAALQNSRGGLLRSYEQLEATDFDRAHGNCAYVYDNAAAGIALLAAGRVEAARALGEALVAAQQRDRFWHDGRFRNAYAAGPVAATGPYPLPGWWDAAARVWREDAYQVGTSAGVVAWAMLFLLHLASVTGESGYRAAAARAGDWVEARLRGPRGYLGGFMGWEPSPPPLTWVSTEHNLDLAVVFDALGRTAAAQHARDFVASMWDAGQGHFAAGLTPAGTVNHAVAADANLWPLLAPGAAPAWRSALDWVLAHQGVPAGDPEGIGFNDDRDGIWLEGTAYVALLARPAVARRMMQTLEAETSPSGLVWATTVPRLTTGFSTGLSKSADFFYYRRPHVGATAWAVLAALEVNPFVLRQE